MMKDIKLNINNALGTKELHEQYVETLPAAKSALSTLYRGDGKGADFLGWIRLPHSIEPSFLSDLKMTADRLREDCEYVVSIGIGGSYLGIKATVEALQDSFAAYKRKSGAALLYAGNHISEDYLYELMTLLKGKKFGIINISKSGTTTEPAIAFRLLSQMLEKEQGEQFAKDHIVAITDAHKGALRTLADKKGYKSYIIPDDIGGRFTVLTPVGLLPIAVAGFDIEALVKGAQKMQDLTNEDIPIADNPAAQYAVTRNLLYKNGKKIEVFANFSPKLQYVGEWLKQLYAESEGKDAKGIFPASANFTTDLHSIGQMIQQGERNLFETFISIDEPRYRVEIPSDSDNLDGLNFISGKRVDFVNKMAEQGTLLAHLDGDVPNIHISIPRLDEYSLGQLYYFFEIAVGISGYLLGVNPFNQPGVEDYKKNMFALLGKPGYEDDTDKIQKRLDSLK